MRIGPHLTHVVVGGGADAEKLEAALKAGVQLVTEAWLEAAIGAGSVHGVDAAAFAPPLVAAAAAAAAGAGERGAAAAASLGRMIPDLAARAAEDISILAGPPTSTTDAAADGARGVKRGRLSDLDADSSAGSAAPRLSGLLGSLLAATDSELLDGGSVEQWKALNDRLPALKDHLTVLLSKAGSSSDAAPPTRTIAFSEALAESSPCSGLVHVGVSVKRSDGETARSPTKIVIIEANARLGAVEMCLTLRSCELVNAEATCFTWWLTDLTAGKVVYPRGPIELSSHGEGTGEGWAPPPTADLAAFQARCIPAGGRGAEPDAARFLRSLVAALVAEAKKAAPEDLLGFSMWKQMEEFLDSAPLHIF